MDEMLAAIIQGLQGSEEVITESIAVVMEPSESSPGIVAFAARWGQSYSLTLAAGE